MEIEEGTKRTEDERTMGSLEELAARVGAAEEQLRQMRTPLPLRQRRNADALELVNMGKRVPAELRRDIDNLDVAAEAVRRTVYDEVLQAAQQRRTKRVTAASPNR